jgi:cell division septum initiation protein DivIVA
MIPYVNRPAHPATLRRTEGLNDCMNAKSLLKIIPALMISAAMATTTIGAGKINPEAVSKGMLTTLNNQVGLSADQQDKAKSIIDKHVADLEAVKNDATLDKAAKKAKVAQLRQQYVTDINGVLTPDQQKKWAAARETTKAKVKARVKEKAAEKAPQ